MKISPGLRFILISIFFFSFITVQSQCLRSGLKTIPGNYATLTAAVADLVANGLAGPVILELQANYNSALETYPITLGSINCASSVNTITIRPAANAGNISISSTNTTTTIDINNGHYWIIDGRNGGVGSTNALTISNTGGGLSSSALRFVNGAFLNVLRYVSFIGTAPSPTSGVIVFTFINPVANTNNLITFCNISGNATAASPSVGVAQNGIYAIGNVNAPNVNNSITNSNIFDCFRTSTATTSSGIFLSTGNSNWVINTTSFYFTTTKTATGGIANVFPINISSPTGTGFFIANNIIGGSGPGSVGTMNLTGQIIFKGMNLSVGSFPESNVQANTIINISINSSVAPPFEGISATNGNYNIGDLAGNIIGGYDNYGSINITASPTISTLVESKGIIVNPSVDGITNISNNLINSITVLGSTAIAHGFIAISDKGNTTTISNNVIGGNITGIKAPSICTNTLRNQQLIGIQANCTTVTINNNYVYNLNNNYAPAPSTSLPTVRGIVVTGSGTVSNNIVHDLYAYYNVGGAGENACISGIQQLSGMTGDITISGNTIYAIQNKSTSGQMGIVGINFNSSTNTGIVSGNYIHGMLQSSHNSIINGILITNGTATYQNNMIGLGYDTLGNSSSFSVTTVGIWETGGTNNKFYHNTVYIGGTNVDNFAWQTFAFRSSIAGNRDIRNNIFINARSNAGIGGKHYAIAIGGSGVNPPGVTMDYNIYRATGNGGVFGLYQIDRVNLAAWQTATGRDQNTKDVSPCLANPESGFPDLHLTNCAGGAGSPADMGGTLIASIVDDIDGESRAALTPTDIGADAILNNNYQINLKVYLEGFYTGNGLMNNNGAGGCLYVTHLSGTNTDADSLFLTLVDGSTKNPLKKASGVLHTDGTAHFQFDTALTTNCYLKVNHRNSLETWSSVVINTGTTNQYDFTQAASQAYGNNMTETFDHLGWAFYSGDICNNVGQVGLQNGLVDVRDYSATENGVFNSYLGYVTEDLTGDGLVESNDYVLSQNNYFYMLVLMKP